MRLSWIGLAAAGALALGGCAYDDYGYGGGYYGGLGYGGGYSAYGYAAPYYGWYDDYYYPGAGVYVYDSGRNRHVWSDRQRSYWSGRQATTGGSRTYRQNWSGFRHHRTR
jgi:hypothetical protein